MAGMAAGVCVWIVCVEDVSDVSLRRGGSRESGTGAGTKPERVQVEGLVAARQQWRR